MPPHRVRGPLSRPSSLLLCVLLSMMWTGKPAAFAQSLGNYGSLRGIILDPSNAAIPSAKVTLSNPLTGVQRTVSADAAGAYQLNGIPFGSYQVNVLMEGFQEARRTVSIGSAVPMELNIMLALA